MKAKHTSPSKAWEKMKKQVKHTAQQWQSTQNKKQKEEYEEAQKKLDINLIHQGKITKEQHEQARLTQLTHDDVKQKFRNLCAKIDVDVLSECMNKYTFAKLI
jgi:hypothetical protein